VPLQGRVCAIAFQAVTSEWRNKFHAPEVPKKGQRMVAFSGVHSSEGVEALSPEACLGVANRPEHQAPKVRRHSSF